MITSEGYIIDDESDTKLEYTFGEVLKLYSGKQIDIQFVALDDFWNLSPDFDKMKQSSFKVTLQIWLLPTAKEFFSMNTHR